ncbi:MAG: hemagglutinin repeat-containing protein, partial [Polaromonas sp.]|uniref:hemagglutinin repeat-containing protein n=1 Tax=Polaromonas sp. TaxID=1869339 RepID=UPI0017BC623E
MTLVASDALLSTSAAGAGNYQYTGIDRIAGLYVTAPGGTLLASAGRDINLLAAQLLNDAPTAAGQPAGSTTLTAGRDIHLGAINQSEQSNATLDPRNYIRFGQSSDVGTTIAGQGNVTLIAGNNLTAKAADITSEQGAAGLYAGNDITLLAGAATRNMSTASFAEGSSFFSSGSTEIKNHQSVSTAQVTTIKGDSASVFAGHDALLEGTRIIARGNATVAAGNNLIAAAAQDS